MRCERMRPGGLFGLDGRIVWTERGLLKCPPLEVLLVAFTWYLAPFALKATRVSLITLQSLLLAAYTA